MRFRLASTALFLTTTVTFTSCIKKSCYECKLSTERSVTSVGGEPGAPMTAEAYETVCDKTESEIRDHERQITGTSTTVIDDLEIRLARKMVCN